MPEPTQSKRIVLVERVQEHTQFEHQADDADQVEHEAWIAKRETERALYANEIESTKQAIRQILAVDR